MRSYTILKYYADFYNLDIDNIVSILLSKR